MSLKSSIFSTNNLNALSRPYGKKPSLLRPSSPYINNASKNTISNHHEHVHDLGDYQQQQQQQSKTTMPNANGKAKISSKSTPNISNGKDSTAWDFQEIIDNYEHTYSLPPILSPKLPSFFESNETSFPVGTPDDTNRSIKRLKTDNKNNSYIDLSKKPQSSNAMSKKSQPYTNDEDQEMSLKEDLKMERLKSNNRASLQVEAGTADLQDEDYLRPMCPPTLPAIFNNLNSLEPASPRPTTTTTTTTASKTRPTKLATTKNSNSYSERQMREVVQNNENHKVTSKDENSTTKEKKYAFDKDANRTQDPLTKIQDTHQTNKKKLEANKEQDTMSSNTIIAQKVSKPSYSKVTTAAGSIQWINKVYDISNPRFLVRIVLLNKVKYLRHFTIPQKVHPLDGGYGNDDDDDEKDDDDDDDNDSDPVNNHRHNKNTKLDGDNATQDQHVKAKMEDMQNIHGGLKINTDSTPADSVASPNSVNGQSKIPVRKRHKIYIENDSSDLDSIQRPSTSRQKNSKDPSPEQEQSRASSSSLKDASITAKAMAELDEERRRFARFRQAKMKEIEDIERANKELEKRLKQRESELRDESERYRQQQQSAKEVNLTAQGSNLNYGEKQLYHNSYIDVSNTQPNLNLSLSESETLNSKLKDRRGFWQNQAKNLASQFGTHNQSRLSGLVKDAEVITRVCCMVDVVLMQMVACDYDERSKIVMRVLPSERSWMKLDTDVIEFITQITETIEYLKPVTNTKTNTNTNKNNKNNNNYNLHDANSALILNFLKVIRCLLYQLRALLSKHICMILTRVIDDYRLKIAKSNNDYALLKKIIELQVQERDLKTLQAELFANGQPTFLSSTIEFHFPNTWSKRSLDITEVLRWEREQAYSQQNLKKLHLKPLCKGQWGDGGLFYLPLGLYSSLSEMSSLLYLITREFIEKWNQMNLERERWVLYRLQCGPPD
ncbi:predicted protein [Lodderomyces elongisporus NRRL YB-4239]|uniref:Uncharacterized protein n=1 Tax=Lodderomyces elongisporus (strain ATCC 11503 / CBS 2605 / JCM 1781 / NBRC 1676 / NRRL YB-4239) TaxID=379508 RepID=A5DT07_LODEL|nr:predicted protein [Lodderomyces elongisporus NRRL YB-4239]